MLVVPFDRNMVKATKSNVFVKNLGPNATNKSLYELFKDFGEVFSVRLAQDYKGTSKGYGYVQFRNPDDALRAIKEMNGKEIDGRKLLVDIYKAGERRDRDSQRFTNVFVKNLPADVTTKEALDKIFARFGPRTSVGVFSREFEGKPSYYGL
jgi:polyadenylate-binding protein